MNPAQRSPEASVATTVPCPMCGGSTRRYSQYRDGEMVRRYRKCKACGERFVEVNGNHVDKRNNEQDREEPWYMEGAFD